MIRSLWRYIGAYKTYAIWTPILTILEVFCELSLPLFMAKIVDIGIPNGDIFYISRIGILTVLISSAGMVCGIVSAKFSAVVGQGFGANLRKGLFDRVQEFSFSNIDRFSTASLITRITNDVSLMQTLVSVGLRILARAPAMMISALVIAIVISPKLSLVLAVAIPAMSAAAFLLMRKAHKLFALVQKRIDELNNCVQENLIAVRVVKAFVREDHERKKFRHSNDALTSESLGAMMRAILLQPMMMLVFYAAAVAVLWNGGIGVMAGELQVGALSSFINYIFQILMSVMMLTFALIHFSRVQASATRIAEVLAEAPDIREKNISEALVLPEPKGAIEFRRVDFKYPGSGTGDNVLQGLEFCVEPGEFVAIVGGTGAGKSSLVHLIPRFYDVLEGQVLLDGLDVREYPIEELRSRIGMVLQTNILFSGTIRSNLLWGSSGATEAEMIAACRQAQIFDFIESLPNGLDSVVEQGGVNLSGGQKQRLCIARAILKKPSVLILDDSTSALDSMTEARLRGELRAHFRGTTLLMVAQRISSVRFADRIIVLNEDHIEAMGTHEQLLESSWVYQEIYTSQQKGGVRE